MNSIPIIPSIYDLARTSDAWLVDIWGVMHNGVSAFDASGQACAAFRAAGGYVVLLTNAPRPAPAVVAQLARVGVRPDAYDAIVTSGDVTRGLVETWKGKGVHHLGPDRDQAIFTGLDVDFATSLDADIVVCSGLIDDETETPADYTTTLKGFARRDLLMLCANPDLQVERGDKLVYCAGALAQAYEGFGGRVLYSGKPHLPIYELAFGVIEAGLGRAVDRDRILAIGDGVKTDIAGAAAAGLRSVFIASGIHVANGKSLDPAFVEELFNSFDQAGKPVAAMQEFRW
jgi:HAD superfamily hydrolase (TIGR01459 family)